MKFKNKVFRQIRKQQRWTTRALSAQIGVTPATLHLWERGHHDPPVEKLAALAETLKVELTDIIEHDGGGDFTISFKKEAASAGNLLKTITTYEKSKLEESVISISKNARYLSERIKELSMVFTAIMQADPAFCYIKDISQNYVMVSNVFLSTLGFAADFDIKGKKDKDFYPVSEAQFNSKEDDEVMRSGIPVRYVERCIPGTRKSRYSIVFKVPILGINSSPIGVMGTFLDITERKKAEHVIEILKKAMETLDETIWIAKDALPNPGGGIIFSKFLYVINSSLRRKLLKGKESLPINELVDYYNKELIISENRGKHNYKRLMEKKKSEITYDIRVPGENRVIKMKDKIYYIPDMGIFVGLIQER